MIGQEEGGWNTHRADWARLFHRLKIGRFSGSQAQLFLAPPIAALSVESRSVPAVVSTSRLLLIFNLWAAGAFCILSECFQ